MTGNGNTFDGMTFTTGGTVEPFGSGGNDQVNDSGIDNYVINAWNGSGRRFAENYARFPTGINDGAYLMGDSQTPYVSLADLHTTCADWTIIPHSPATGWCVQDTGAAINGNTAGNYFYAPSSTSGYIQFIFNGTPMAVGYRLPSGSVYLMLAGYSSSAASQQFKVYESNANTLVGTCTFAMTASLYVHGGPNSSDPCPINLSSIATGDPLYIQFSLPTTASLNVQWIDFKPQWSDPLVGPSLSVTGNTAAATVTATTSVTAPVVNASTSTGLQVGGSQVTTGNLGDWTNAGVANGYLPTWSAATGKWMPGAPPATSTGGLTDWTNAGIANGYVPAWNAGTGKWSPTAPATTVYPQQVASIASATYSGTTTLAPMTLYAVPSGKAGQYRLCTNYSVTAVGTAGTAVAAIRYTTDGQAVGYGGIGAPVNTTLRTLTSFPINCYEFYADASSSIMWELQLTGVTGSPTFRYAASLEYMGP